MIQRWKYKDGTMFDIDTQPFTLDINLNALTLPIITNVNESSEKFLIQLLELYTECDIFVKKILNIHSNFSNVPHGIIVKMDSLFNIFVSYIDCLGIKQYGFKSLDSWKEDDPFRKSPYCSYVYTELLVNCDNLRKTLDKKGLTRVIENFIEEDTDWN